MPDAKVRQLQEDLHSTHPALGELAERAREVVRAGLPGARERVMYGGFMFAAPALCCGVFAYTGHVSVEFGEGARFADPHGVLEGTGKQRRHIKLRALGDIEAKHLAEYIEQVRRHLADGPGGTGTGVRP